MSYNIFEIQTVSFSGMDVLPIDVQLHISAGMAAFSIVGLPDKAVAESRERVRSALLALGLSLPPKRVIINLAPADVVKEGSHYDVAIALVLLAGLKALPSDILHEYIALGELSLDGSLREVNGVLPAAVYAASKDKGFICPKSQGREAKWSGLDNILASPSLLALVNHFKGRQVLSIPEKGTVLEEAPIVDFAHIKGQESAKRMMEIAASGGHHSLLIGPPGAGKSLLASALPGIMPPLSAQEALETSMIQSLNGLLKQGQIQRTRPFRVPHHSASLPALVGGGSGAKPGEISLAHNGVLFLDELPEFQRTTLEAMRQPMESGEVVVARANHRACYPARFQLVAAMNPCRCGYVADVDRACSRAPKCASDHQSKLSGPILDRIDMVLEVSAMELAALQNIAPGETSETIRKRVIAARNFQKKRFQSLGLQGVIAKNADITASHFDQVITLIPELQAYALRAAEHFRLSARSYHRLLKVARTIADLDRSETIQKHHIAEAFAYRLMSYKKIAA